MANGILSAKLQEMDGQFSLLHDRIQMCDSLNVDCIHELLQTIIAECDEKDTSLRQNLEHSQVEETAVLLEQYNAIETVICQAKKTLEVQPQISQNREETAEELSLLAEYELDFAMLAANRALAVSTQALEAQLRIQT